jgi:hypothetical protein
MRGLTLHEPYASAIVYGPKRIENRTWGNSRLQGEVLAIHAAKRRWNPTEGELEAIRNLWPEVPVPERMQSGCIIGTARIKEVCRKTNARVRDDPWCTGPVCWVLHMVSSLQVPIYCQGNKGLWELDKDIARQMNQPIAQAVLCGCGEGKLATVLMPSIDRVRYACTDCAGITKPLPGHTRYKWKKDGRQQ